MSSRRRARAAFASAAALLLASGAARAQPLDAPMPTLTLDEAIAGGLANASEVVRAKGNVSVSEVSRKRSLAAYFPTLGLSAGTAHNVGNRYDQSTLASSSTTSLNAGLSASWPIFTGFRRSAERAQAEAELGGARAQLVDSERSVALDVTGAFYAALSAERLLGVASSRMERAQAGLKAAERRAELGSATRSDVLRAQLEVNAARTQSLEVETQLRGSRLQLGRLVGVAGPVRPSAPSESSEEAAVSFSDEELESLVSAHPAVVAADASARASEAGIRAARSEYWPSLGLTAGYDWYADPSDFAGQTTGWGVRLGLNFPIWDGFLRDEGIARARAAAATARAADSELRRSTRAALQTAADRLRLAAEQVRVADESVDAAREDLRVQQSRYALGATTMLDLLRSQEAVVTAETDAVSARFDRALARAELDALTGRAAR